MPPKPFNSRQQRRLRALTTAALSTALIRERRRQIERDNPTPPPPEPPQPPPMLPGFDADPTGHLPRHSRH